VSRKEKKKEVLRKEFVKLSSKSRNMGGTTLGPLAIR
jgi:hypothetical protein